MNLLTRWMRKRSNEFNFLKQLFLSTTIPQNLHVLVQKDNQMIQRVDEEMLSHASLIA